MARQSSAKASTSVRIRSGPLPIPLRKEGGLFLIMKLKILHQIGIVACLLLALACFLPWTFHADLNKNFTGFFSENNNYGKPGKFLVGFALISMGLFSMKKVWAKRVHLFLSALTVGYAIKTFILFASCYNAYCPEKKPGLYLMLISTILILIASIFPDIKLKPATKKD